MTKEIYNTDVAAFIEYPVNNAVTVLNRAGYFTVSSGFHSQFTEERFKLKPCWAVIVEGTINDKLQKLIEGHDLNSIENYPVNGLKKWLMTIIYLHWNIAIEKNAQKAKITFDKFAEQITLGRRSYKKTAQL